MEALGLLAARAERLDRALQKVARKGGHVVLINGTLIRTRRRTGKDNRRHYSGKHKAHGLLFLALTDDWGRLLWISAARSGRSSEITTARYNHLVERLRAQELGVIGDLCVLSWCRGRRLRLICSPAGVRVAGWCGHGQRLVVASVRGRPISPGHDRFAEAFRSPHPPHPPRPRRGVVSVPSGYRGLPGCECRGSPGCGVVVGLCRQMASRRVAAVGGTPGASPGWPTGCDGRSTGTGSRSREEQAAV